jgi:hypothetical protein
MESANQQTYEPGDIIALQFRSPEEEAEYIAKTCKALRGHKARSPKSDPPPSSSARAPQSLAQRAMTMVFPHLSAMLVRESRLMRTGLVERIEHRPDLLALFRR